MVDRIGVCRAPTTVADVTVRGRLPDRAQDDALADAQVPSPYDREADTGISGVVQLLRWRPALRDAPGTRYGEGTA